MNTTKQKLVDSIQQRLIVEIVPQNPVKFLLKIPIEDILSQAISVIYLYTRKGRGKNKDVVLMAEVISAIGHGIRNKAKLSKNSSAAAKAGAFILYSFELEGILRVELGKGTGAHATYLVELLNDDLISELWDKLVISKTEKLPVLQPYADWTSTKHETGMVMVKTADKEVLSKITPETHPMIYGCLNKAQQVGWWINDDILKIQAWSLRNKTDAFKDIWDITNPEAKRSKIREANAIEGIAKRLAGEVFWHLYYMDFRGRKYASTAYLHEQGTDQARGLLLRADNKPIGEQGFFWLCISIASNWAGDAGRYDGYKTDKIPLNDRVEWVLDNEEIIISYAENPKVNQGWMQADKCWQFLAACFEFKKLREWQCINEMDFSKPYEEYGYESHLECYIDGSNNGAQHLTALTRDEATAPHVNLVPLKYPGDLYLYVGTHVWDFIKDQVSYYTPEQVSECEWYIDTLTDMKHQVNEAEPKSERRKILVEQLIQFRKDHDALSTMSAPIFWLRITDDKHKRKICKRNIMTLPYGGTPYGLGQQQIDDARKHNIEQLNTMEHRWGSFLGRAVYDDCKTSIKKPMQLLSVFEEAGRIAEEQGKFLSWTVPVTNFPVVQHYVEGVVHPIYIQYGPTSGERDSRGYYPNTYKLHICYIEEVVPSNRKQSQGAAPNAIHSLDAAHLTLTIERCNFPITTIHDSFGCLLGDMPELFVIIRETFVELYNADPLSHLMKDIGDISGIELGTLDLNLILESEYAFC